MTKIKLRGKVFKIGSSYAIRVPKALIDTELILAEKEYVWSLEFEDGLCGNWIHEPNYFRKISEKVCV